MPSVCDWVRSVLVAYLDGELKPSVAQAVRRHLERCEACRARARLLAETWDVLDEAPPPPVRPDFTERMMLRVVEERELAAMAARLRPHRLRRKVAASVLGLAAGLVLGLAVSDWTGMFRRPASPVEDQVSRCVSALEDVELLDEIAVIEAMDALGPTGDDGA